MPVKLNMNFNLLINIALLGFSAVFILFYWLKNKSKQKITETAIFLISFSLIVSLSHLMFHGKAVDFSTNLLNNYLSSFTFFLALISIISSKDLLNEKLKLGEYYFLTFTTLIGSILLINTQNMLNMFISIELISMSLYGIIALNKEVENIEASIKYFILGSFASIFMVVSLFLAYLSSSTLNLNGIQVQFFINPNPVIVLSIILFLAGFVFKLALFPLSSWALDVYCGSPTNIVLFMVGFVKLSIIIAAYRIFLSINSQTLTLSLYIFVLLTLIIPNISALFTRNIKKIIAYSSISHAGYISLAFLGPESWQIYFYAIVYTISAIGIFSIIYFLEKNYSSVDYNNIKGLYHKNPALALSLAVFLFSLAGVPPLSGFFAKFYAFYNALNNGYKWLVIIAALTSAISLYYYIKILIPVFFENNDEKFEIYISKTNLLIIHFTAILVILLGIFSNKIIILLKFI